MKKIYVFLFATFAMLAAGSCNIINPSEVVPTYVRIDSFVFQNDVVRGSASHKVTNVWVYFNGSPVGNFDLPAQFPVIATEAGTLTVIPGIDFDGLSGYPLIYPLYRSDTLHLVPAPGAVIPFGAKTGYNAASILKFEERFDNGQGRNNSFIRTSGDTTIFNTNDPGVALEGGGAGIMRLAPGFDSAVVLSGPVLPIIAGSDAYIELDYRGTCNLRVGMYSKLNAGGEYTEQIIGLKPKDNWGKIYVSITSWISAHQGSEYRVLLRADKLAGQQEGYVLVDNVKVVSF